MASNSKEIITPHPYSVKKKIKYRFPYRAGAQRSGSERKRRVMTLVEYCVYTIFNIVSYGKELMYPQN